MQRERALELLQSVGMSGYEAKAYLALLVHGAPMNGYEVAKASGVPRSTVYETLSKLVARGAAFEVKPEAGAMAYVALPADALVSRLRRETIGTIDDLGSILPSLGRPPSTRVVTHVHGQQGVLERATDVIDAATISVLVSLWPAEAEALRVPLERAVARGVDVSVLVFGPFDPPVGRVYRHRYSQPAAVFAMLGYQIFTIVADHDAVLIAGKDAADVWGVWSDDPAVALVAAEYVRHDIALQLVADRLHEEGLDDFWSGNPDLERLRAASRTAAAAAAPPG